MTLPVYQLQRLLSAFTPVTTSSITVFSRKAEQPSYHGFIIRIMQLCSIMTIHHEWASWVIANCVIPEGREIRNQSLCRENDTVPIYYIRQENKLALTSNIEENNHHLVVFLNMYEERILQKLRPLFSYWPTRQSSCRSFISLLGFFSIETILFVLVLIARLQIIISAQDKQHTWQISSNVHVF